MLSTYVSIAWRRLAVAPVYTAISILGLAIGLACFVLAMLYVEDERSFDRFWRHAPQMFIVETDLHTANGGDPVHYENTYPRLGPLIAANLSGITSVARRTRLDFLVSSDEQRFYEQVWFVDPALADIFDFEFIAGTAEDALRSPMSVVLTQSYAMKFFGGDAMGRDLMLDGRFTLRVAGIIKDLPDNSHLRMGMFSHIDSMDSMIYSGNLRQWRGPNVRTYMRLDASRDAAVVEQQLAELVRTHFPEALRERVKLSLTPVSDLRQRYSDFGGINTLPLMLLVGALVLGMACINTINLTTAKGTERTKELGVRKVLGASRPQLIAQFLAEAMVSALISLCLAVLIVEWALPSFNRLFDKQLSFDYLSDAALAGKLLLLSLATGLLAGAYPALVLSRFKAADAFRGNVHFGSGAAGFRTAMVMVQFGLAITLSIATLFVYLQMSHMRQLDLGFDRDNIVVLENLGWTDIRPRFEALRTELLKHPNILEVSSSLAVPGREFERVSDFHVSGKDLADSVSLNRMSVDFDFFNAYGIEMVAGRGFSRDYGTDVVQGVEPGAPRPIFSAIINEAAARHFGWSDPQQAIGHVIATSDNAWTFDGRIIGVVSDFHILAGHGAMAPYVYVVSPQFISFASVKISAADVPATLAHIDAAWDRVIPHYPIVRSFLDETLQAAYLRWERNGMLMVVLSILAIVISALGCFGLAAYSTKCRRKEIGMRKVLGASVTDVVSLLTWDFSKPVLIANLLAAPVAYWGVQRWLEGYAYRIDMSVMVFLAVAFASLALSALVVSFHAVKAAMTSPAQTFRHL